MIDPVMVGASMDNPRQESRVSWQRRLPRIACLLLLLGLALGSAAGADLELVGTGCRLITGASGRTLLQSEEGDPLLTVEGWRLETKQGILALSTSPAEIACTECGSDSAWVSITSSLPECDLSLRLRPSPSLPRVIADLEITYHDSLDLIAGGLVYDLAEDASVLKGLRAISSRDSCCNQVQSCLTPRILQSQWEDHTARVIVHGAQEGAYGVELVAEDRILFFDGELHETILKRPDYDSQLEHRWRRRGPGDRDSLRVVFCVDVHAPLPIINPYPGRIPAALTVIDDADGEREDILLAAYYGTSDLSDPNFGHGGFLGHSLRITRSVFPSSDLYHVWDRLAADGTEIAVHTFSGGPDTADETRAGLEPLVERYGTRHWVDHSVSSNPEDLCYRGSYPRINNPHYVLGILEEFGFDYAWVELNMFQGFDACSDRRELPHLCEAIDDPVIPGQLHIYGRTGGVFFTNYWQALDRIVTPESLEDLIASGGMSLIYTHTCVVNYLDQDVGYLRYEDGAWKTKVEAEQLLGLLEGRVNSGELWVAPASELFDRLIQTNAVRLEKQPRSDVHIWHLHNSGQQPASDLGLKILNTRQVWLNGMSQTLDSEDWLVIGTLGAGETIELRLEPNRLQITPSDPLRINCGGDELQPGDDVTYLADQAYDAGSGFGYIEGEAYSAYRYLHVGGTSEPGVYLTERVGDVKYRFDLPVGSYIFTLHLAPMLYHGPDMGRFQVQIGQTTIESDMDLAKHGPRCHAQDLRFEHTTDGTPLLLQALGSLGDAEIAGIEIHASSSPWPTVEPPTDVQAWSCPGGVFLHWQDQNPPTVAGFEVLRRTETSGRTVMLDRTSRRLLRHWDASASQESSYTYAVVAIDVRGVRSDSSWVGPLRPGFPAVDDIPTYFLTIDPDTLLALNESVHSNRWVGASLRWSDGSEQAVEVRYRGDTSRHFQKKSFKVKYHPVPGETKRSILNLAWKVDASGLRENLAAKLFDRAGLPAPTTTACHLVLNGESQGLYTQLEQLNDDFLDARDMDDDGVLIKVEDGNLEVLDNPSDYAQAYERKTGDEADLTPMIGLVETVDLTPDDEFAETVWSVVDIPWFLDWYASIVLMANYDVTRENHYWYLPPEQGKWRVLPWDNDHGFYHILARHWPLDLGTAGSEPMVPSGPNRLFTRVLEIDTFRWLYAAKLSLLSDRLLEGEYTLHLIDSLHAHVGEALNTDRLKLTWEDNAAAAEAIEELHAFTEARLAFVNEHLPALAVQPADQPRINELCWSTVSTSGWIEIYNGSPLAVAADDLLLSNSPVADTRWVLGSGEIPEGGYWVVGLGEANGFADHTIDFSPESMPADFVLLSRTNGTPEALDAIPWPRHLADGVIARLPSEAGRWRATAVATPALENEDVGSTRESLRDALRLRPCPSHLGSMMECDLKRAGNVRIDLLDVTGRHIAKLHEGWLGGGTTLLPEALGERAGVRLTTGVYYLRMSGVRQATNRIVLID